VKLLLDKGADVNAHGVEVDQGRADNPLRNAPQAASAKGHKQIVKLEATSRL
jgi:hypothetical protein